MRLRLVLDEQGKIAKRSIIDSGLLRPCPPPKALFICSPSYNGISLIVAVVINARAKKPKERAASREYTWKSQGVYEHLPSEDSKPLT